jgi:hypothetical protein
MAKQGFFESLKYPEFSSKTVKEAININTIKNSGFLKS